MTPLDRLALLVIVVTSIAIVIYLYMSYFNIRVFKKKGSSGKFLIPIYYPEEGDDYTFCGICHGRLGSEKVARCSCGGRYHIECVALHNCPECNNDLKHMRRYLPKVLSCPICLRRTSEGHCYHCGITVPSADGTFRCQECGGKVMVSHPVCRKCGTKYSARTTKGYMDRVR